MDKFFKDILKDTGSDKFSMTKFSVLVALSLWSAQIITSLYIMVSTKTIDHIVIAEVVSFILILLGYKNKFGVSKDSKSTVFTSDNTGTAYTTETNTKTSTTDNTKPVKQDDNNIL
jgi:hypothetical protein